MVLKVVRLALVAGLLASSGPTYAQEVKPDPINDVTRYRVYFYKFTAEGKDLARKLLWNHMLPAMREAKVPEPLILHPDDGEWDMISLNPLPGGYADLHFNASPTDARWQSVAMKKDAETFKALGASLQKQIVRETSFLAHRHNSPNPE